MVRSVEIEKLWRDHDLEQDLLNLLALDSVPLRPGEAVGLASSFQVSDAAQTSIAAAALAAVGLYQLRSGKQQQVTVSRRAAEAECTGYFRLNGKTPDAWAKFSGLYATNDGHVRIHANFDHHRDGVLRLLDLPPADQLQREDLAAALATWSAQEFEDAAAANNLVVAKVRSFDEWDQHPHAQATQAHPLVTLTQLDHADVPSLPAIDKLQRPLTGLRVLDLTRILAGPVCGRTLAAYGADVMLINSPALPNIESIVETSRGKRSAHLDLSRQQDSNRLKQLVQDVHIFVQGYRPGGLDALGYASAELAKLRPGIVCVNLSAYGTQGPWSQRRGFDSLVQTATGFNHAEAIAFSNESPQALPVQILDYASGFLMAWGAQAALLKQATLGGSWQVDVSLLQTANWLRSLGRSMQHLEVSMGKLSRYLQPYPCTIGDLMAMPHAASFSATPAIWQRPASLPGTDQPSW